MLTTEGEMASNNYWCTDCGCNNIFPTARRLEDNTGCFYCGGYSYRLVSIREKNSPRHKLGPLIPPAIEVNHEF